MRVHFTQHPLCARGHGPIYLALFKVYYNHSRKHASLDGNTPAEISGERVAQPAPLNSYAWEKHCDGLFQLPVAA